MRQPNRQLDMCCEPGYTKGQHGELVRTAKQQRRKLVDDAENVPNLAKHDVKWFVCTNYTIVFER